MSMTSYFRNKYEELLDTILSAEELIAVINDIEKHNTSEQEHFNNNIDLDQNRDKSVWNKELMTKMLSSLLNVSLTKLKNKNELDLLANTELNNYLNKNQEFLNQNNGNIEDEPFLALFLDKLITRLVPERLPIREKLIIDEIVTNDLNTTIQDESEQKVSVGILASNIHKLSGSMEKIFEFQDTIIRIISWKVPSKMIISLLILTKICYNPMYIILFPLLYLSLGIIMNNYNVKYGKKHLYSTSHRRKIGKSLFTDLFKYDPMRSIPINSPTTQLSTPQEITHGMQVVINLRDFQNLTTNQLHLLESSSKFLNETAAFKDERTTTILLFSILSICITLKLLSFFLNWNFVLSSALWISAIIIHPKLLPKLKLLFNTYHLKKEIYQPNPAVKDKHFDIVLDQQPRTHTVEIFEIYREGLIPTTWKFFIFSSSLFDPFDQYRKSQTPPPGVKELTMVQPPKGWIFDPNDDWKIDYDFNKWKKEKNLQVSIDQEFLIDSNFKRRRLTRRVIQSHSN